MELFATNLFFRGDSAEQQRHDLCIHGQVTFLIGEDSLSEPDDRDWCVSASAYRFLRTLKEDHVAGHEEYLIPCCGHFMVPSEDGEGVDIIGCSNGIDFSVRHEDGAVLIETAAGKVYTVSYEDYESVVVDYALQIYDYYEKSPARYIENDHDGYAFSVFMKDYRRRLTEFVDLL